jgi:predicted component of type VI protein secretion system
MRIRPVVAAVVVAAGVVGVSAPHASANDPSTTVTFAVTSGALTLSVPVSANLGSGAPGTAISASIGPMTVTDDRALLSASWTVTVAETDFANGGQVIPATDATYTPGTITTTGVITVTTTNLTLANTAQAAVTGTAGVGDNTASWDPSVAVNVPASAVGGLYTGTLTHSVS